MKSSIPSGIHSVRRPPAAATPLCAMTSDHADPAAHSRREPTAWRAVERVDAEHLERLRAVRAAAREREWVAGAGPDISAGLVIDLDATITVAHSEKQNAAATWKRTYGSTRCWPTWTGPTSRAVRRWPGCRARERGQQHRRRSRHRAGPGAGRSARAGQAPPGCNCRRGSMPALGHPGADHFARSTRARSAGV